ncbi:MAG: EutN/CcmL family microcompartment protein [Opitutae bacterium]|jgi:ethanolamine utilization protein EutN|nr:EutN/CcmL family microcompartment protein [Opitutae bacterium]MBT4224067.1 EutN/CcmL family microcompartment protein [Opitutae bacterium]MBT5380230.1 EutN/CcmL family microcompartment protein [Opitutae bacterium]MBT5691995.1 EutN/CcmL family microcompartment protein [Opitutae bacterium]MBT6463419.1 EutN/CcmL family microcompartment protein [Opitutae bacterium]
MYLGKVIGSVVSTKKEESMKGRKLLMIRPMLVDPEDSSRFKPGNNTIVAIDTLGAGEDELVMFAQGSSARQAEGLKSIPVDAAIVGLVDSVTIQGTKTFEAKNS